MVIVNECMRVSIKEGLVKDSKALAASLFKANLISTRDRRKHAGRASHMSGLLFARRPFLEALWAALATAANQKD